MTTRCGSSLKAYAVRLQRVARNRVIASGADDAGDSHFPPAFVFQLPLAMVEVPTKLGLQFLDVKYGQSSVLLVVSDFLHIWIEVEKRGLQIDFIALYDGESAEARMMLPEILRVFQLGVRLQLSLSGCLLTGVTDEDRRDPELSASQGDIMETVPSATCFGCYYHQLELSNLKECSGKPLCTECIVETGTKRVAGKTSDEPNAKRKCQKGHTVPPERLCFATEFWCRVDGPAVDTEQTRPDWAQKAIDPQTLEILLAERLRPLQRDLQAHHEQHRVQSQRLDGLEHKQQEQRLRLNRLQVSNRRHNVFLKSL